MMYKQFDIVAVKFPFSASVDIFKVRPAIIISNEKSNELDNDFLLCTITTRLRTEPFAFELDGKTILPLPLKSEVRCNKIATVRTNLILRKVTELKKEHRQALTGLVIGSINIK